MCPRAAVGGLSAGLVLLGLACAGSSSGGSDVAAARDVAALLDKETTLVPGQPPAPVYESRPGDRRELAVLADPLRRELFDRVKRAAADQGITVLPDARLDAAMDDLARALREKQTPYRAAVEFLLAHYGVVEPYPLLHVAWARRAPDAVLADELAGSLSIPGSARLVTFGIGIDRATTHWVVVLAVQPKQLDLASVARTLPSGSEVRVSGRLLGRYSNPHMYITLPSGRARKLPILVRQDEFLASVPCDQGDGRYQIEVFGENAFGPKVLANFPVYCGAEPPGEYVGEVGFVPRPISAGQAEAELLERVNRSRQKAGLSQLALDARLTDVARAHSRDMVENGFFGHVSPTTGSPGDRIRTAGLKPRRVLENLGRGSTVDEVHGGLMQSPGHRAAILDPEVTHVGIGVVVQNRGQSRGTTPGEDPGQNRDQNGRQDPGDAAASLFATELFRTALPGD